MPHQNGSRGHFFVSLCLRQVSGGEPLQHARKVNARWGEGLVPASLSCGRTIVAVANEFEILTAPLEDAKYEDGSVFDFSFDSKSRSPRNSFAQAQFSISIATIPKDVVVRKHSCTKACSDC